MSSNTASSANSEFLRRFKAREHLLGTFIKTPTSHAIEILGNLGFDFVVIDEEHAPFDRASIDVGLLAARASGTAGIVRVANPTAANILSVLDCGAAGVLVPHVATPEKAREVAAACRYRGGRRGYSGSPRAGGYGGVSMWPHIDEADRSVTVIAMIEDAEALDHIDEIAQVQGIDGYFIGRSDLTVAMGEPATDAPAVRAAVERITVAAGKANKPVCVMVGTTGEAKLFKQLGASAFIVSSDQGFMRKAAMQALADFKVIAT